MDPRLVLVCRHSLSRNCLSTALDARRIRKQPPSRRIRLSTTLPCIPHTRNISLCPLRRRHVRPSLHESLSNTIWLLFSHLSYGVGYTHVHGTIRALHALCRRSKTLRHLRRIFAGGQAAGPILSCLFFPRVPAPAYGVEVTSRCGDCCSIFFFNFLKSLFIRVYPINGQSRYVRPPCRTPNDNRNDWRSYRPAPRLFSSFPSGHTRPISPWDPRALLLR